MDFNSFVFPTPISSYTHDDFKGELVWIPKKEYYSYRDKIKYNNYKSLIPKTGVSVYNNEMDEKINLENCFSKYDNQINPVNNKKSENKGIYQKTHQSTVHKIPTISFTFDNKFKTENSNDKLNFLPCLFLKTHDKGSNKILIYFHANYEDLGYTYPICAAIRKSLKINVLSVEYPNYGLYKSDKECSSEAIIEDADQIYKFLTEIMNIEENNIIIMGRCIGSGPAVYLASKYHPKSLILVSAFKSIKFAVKSIFDRLKFGWFFEKFVKERFSNIENIDKVSCPTLFIHGKCDDIIPWSHSLDLINNCTCAAKLVTPERMKHNNFDSKKDIINHMKDFLYNFIDKIKKDYKYYYNDILNSEEGEPEDAIHFPIFMFTEPNKQ